MRTPNTVPVGNQKAWRQDWITGLTRSTGVQRVRGTVETRMGAASVSTTVPTPSAVRGARKSDQGVSVVESPRGLGVWGWGVKED